MLLLSIFYLLSFILLAWRNFRLAVILFIIFLPAYLIRVDIGFVGRYRLPTTFLEIAFGVIFLVWLARFARRDIKTIRQAIKRHKIFFVSFLLFFLSSIISIFVSDMRWFSLGEWRAYFLEPMILFLILVGRSSSPPYQGGVRGGLPSIAANTSATPSALPLGKGEITAVQISSRDLIWALAFSTLSISTYSIIQKFTGWGIATPQWSGEAIRRVTAFFSSPNAVGLYLAPVVMLLVIPLLLRGGQGGVAEVKTLQLSSATPPSPPLGKRRMIYALLATLFILSILAIIFTKSQGAWIGLAVGVLVFLFFVGYKKIAVAVAILGIIFSLLIPSMRQAVLFQDQANQNRLRLWGYTWTFLSKSPKNFILGAGVRQFFRKVQKPYYDKIVMERLIYPHNIFLNFWMEIGLFGMFAVITMLGYVFYLANKIRKNYKLIGAGLMGALTILGAHGLVDVPYFKNDLAFLFWIIILIPLLWYDTILSAAHTSQPSSQEGIQRL